MSEFHDLNMNAIDGTPVDFSQYQDHVCLVVNVASR